MNKNNALVYMAAAIAAFLLFSVGWLASEAAAGTGYTVSTERAAAAASQAAELEIPTVNLNTATAEELQLLPGIGATRAAAIIEYRDKNGGFDAAADIMEVSGIGEGIFNRLRDYITVND